MGFQPTSPNASTDTATALINGLTTHGELIHHPYDVPWARLLGGESADAIAQGWLPTVQLWRSRGLRFGFMADLTNPLNRARESQALLTLGRSITEPTVQLAYRAYVLAFARVLQADYIGLAAETNLVRQQAAPTVYAAVVQAANACADSLVAASVSVPLMMGVHVETAWGHGSTSGTFQGIGRELADFPFTQLLGLSSYPYLNHSQPENIPSDYYSRLLSGTPLPGMVTDSGWPSASKGTIVSSPKRSSGTSRNMPRCSTASLHAPG